MLTRFALSSALAVAWCGLLFAADPVHPRSRWTYRR